MVWNSLSLEFPKRVLSATPSSNIGNTFSLMFNLPAISICEKLLPTDFIISPTTSALTAKPARKYIFSFSGSVHFMAPGRPLLFSLARVLSFTITVLYSGTIARALSERRQRNSIVSIWTIFIQMSLLCFIKPVFFFTGECRASNG